MSIDGREQELLEWVSDELSPERRRQVDAHLAECAECRAAVRDMLALSAGLERLEGRVHAEGPGRARQRSWAWILAGAAAAAALLVPVLRDGPDVPGGAGGALRLGRPGGGPDQLLQLDQAVRAGAGGTLAAQQLRDGRSVPVRLAALTAAGSEPDILGPGDLVEAFEAEVDLTVRLWLVVEIARSGDVSAAQRIRGLVAGMDRVPGELREVVDQFLPQAAGEAA